MAGISNPAPIPAQAMPPGVSDAGSQGNIPRYSMENHTHASKVRKEIKPISASGLFTWTFPNPFTAGVVPICNAMAICPSGVTDVVNVQQEGDATETSVTFRVTRYQQSIVALIGLTILSVNAGVPASTKISLEAFEP